MRQLRPTRRTSIRGPALLGLATIAATFGGIGLWSVFLPLASAAIAPGVVVVDGNRRTIQHLEGGVIKAIHVSNSDRVEAGQVLITLEDARIGPTLETLRHLLAANLAQRARLITERTGSHDLVLPEAVEEGVDLAQHLDIVAQQRRYLLSRRAAREAKLAALRGGGEQARTTLLAHQQQFTAQRERLRLTALDLAAVRDLARMGAGTARRVLEVEKTLAEVHVDLARTAAQIAETHARVDAAAREITRVEADFLEEVETETQSNERECIDLRERLRVLTDQARRLEVRSPVAGQIVNRAIHTVGGVVAAGMPLMDVVPENERMIVEAQVRPNDIDRVKPGLPVEIRASTYDGSALPRLMGVVVTVSADRMTDRARGTPYFEVRVAAEGLSLDAVLDRHLRVGMAVDVMILRGERTVVEYLAGSVIRLLVRAMRE